MEFPLTRKQSQMESPPMVSVKVGNQCLPTPRDEIPDCLRSRTHHETHGKYSKKILTHKRICGEKSKIP